MRREFDLPHDYQIICAPSQAERFMRAGRRVIQNHHCDDHVAFMLRDDAPALNDRFVPRHSAADDMLDAARYGNATSTRIPRWGRTQLGIQPETTPAPLPVNDFDVEILNMAQEREARRDLLRRNEGGLYLDIQTRARMFEEVERLGRLMARDDRPHYSVAARLRPYQDEINRVTDRIAENMVMMGESTVRINVDPPADPMRSLSPGVAVIAGDTVTAEHIQSAMEMVRRQGPGSPDRIFTTTRIEIGDVERTPTPQWVNIKCRSGWKKRIRLTDLPVADEDGFRCFLRPDGTIGVFRELNRVRVDNRTETMRLPEYWFEEA